MDLNLTANWRLIRAFDKPLRDAPSGRAVFTTCSMGHTPTAYWSAYAISKAALEMMVRTWAARVCATEELSTIDTTQVEVQISPSVPSGDPTAPPSGFGVPLRPPSQ